MSFLFRETDSDAQYAKPASPYFWVRVCKPTAPRLDISSALQGNLSDDRFAEAMCGILDKQADKLTTTIRFLDIAPNLMADMNDHEIVGRRFDFLSQVVRRWAKGCGRAVRDARLDVHDGRHAANFELE